MYERIRKELSGEGKLPLLSESQLRFLDEVKEIADRKVAEKAYLIEKGSSRKYASVISEKALQAICSAQKYLMEIIKLLKKARKSLMYYFFADPNAGYMQRRRREECKVKLTEVADSINSDRFDCNVLRLVGYSASALGGIMILLSAILIILSFERIPHLAVAGGNLIFAGCVTTVGASVAEITRLKKKMDQAKKLIKEYEECFQDFASWLNHASNLQESLQSVLVIDVLKDVTDSIKKLVEEAAQIINDRERYKVTERYINKLLTTFLPLFRKINIKVSEVSSLLTGLVAIFLLLANTENRVVFDFASVTTKSLLGLSSLLNEAVDLHRLSSLISGSAVVAKKFARAAIRGALAAVGIALDVIGIVFVSKDMCNGSLSPEAKKIKDAVNVM